MQRLVFPVALMGLFLVGCKSGPSLDGAWTMSGAGLQAIPGGKTDGTMTFSGNNVEIKMTMEAEQMGSMTITANGTYTLEGETYDHTITSVKMDSSKVNAAIKGLAEAQFKEDDVKKQMNENAKSTVKFVNDKQVEMSSGQGKLTLNKK